jgi:hypothetical protein
MNFSRKASLCHAQEHEYCGPGAPVLFPASSSMYRRSCGPPRAERMLADCRDSYRDESGH